MEFKQLRSLAAVVKWESFTKAAENLYLSQPTISAHIRQLEEELRAKLIIRTTKSLEITPKGMEIYEYAKAILDLHDRAVRCCASENRNTIYLGASTIPSAYLLPEVLPAYQAQYPKACVAVCQDDSQGVISGLLDGVFDTGMIGMPAQEKNLACIPFYQDRMILITPVNERFLSLHREAEPPIRTLLESPVILREKGSGSKKRGELLLEQLGMSERDLLIAARANDQETIKNLVAGGLGVSIISEKAAQGLVEAGRVLRFEFPGLDSRRDLYLAYRKDLALKSHVRGFLRFIQEFYGGRRGKEPR